MYVLYNMPKALLMLYKHFILISEADQPSSFPVRSSRNLKSMILATTYMINVMTFG